MAEHPLAQTVTTATALLEAGEQGHAQALLRTALAAAAPAHNEAGAVAIATATQLLIECDAGLEPHAVLIEHTERMRSLTAGQDSPAALVARAEAELALVEWVHSAGEVDPVTLVGVLETATLLGEQGGDSPVNGVRLAAAEASVTALMIRQWLDQDPAETATAWLSLAVGLTGDPHPRLRFIRLNALSEAARFRQQTDPDDAEALLRRVLVEAPAASNTRALGWAASRSIAEIGLARGDAPATALGPARAVLNEAFPDDPRSVLLLTGHLTALCELVPAADRDRETRAGWATLLAHGSAHPDPVLRAALLDHLRLTSGEPDDMTATGLALLCLAEEHSRADDHPDTAAARLAVSARIVETLGRPGPGRTVERDAARRDPAEAVRRAEQLERDFGGTDPRLATPLTRLRLERALREADLGRRGQAISLLATVRQAGGPGAQLPPRHLLAQADYWRGRLSREQGDRAVASQILTESLAEYGRDADPDVRVWAANGLRSAWGDIALSGEEADALVVRFREYFAGDSDPRIRATEAQGRLNQAVRAHERGSTGQAVAELGTLIADFGTDRDADTVDTLRLARENLAILSRGGSHNPAGDDDRYRQLQQLLAEAETGFAAGWSDAAARACREVADATANSSDVSDAVLGLAALDLWGDALADSAQWPALVEVSRRAMLSRGALDTRADRIRARAHLRAGMALDRLGDAGAAIATYEALDRLVADLGDDEIMTSRQQAVYNRAVLIDDLGDLPAAILAYDHVLAVHASSRTSPTRVLRQMKALRNQALLFEAAGDLARVAGAHQRVLGLGAGAAGVEVTERVRGSAFALAESCARLGDHATAADTYDWIRAHPGLGCSAAELRTATAGAKAARKQARRR